MPTLIERIEKEAQRSPTSHGPSSAAPFPVLTIAEIVNVEESLNIRLPQILKQLYIQVGNGGFGPGHGLLPLAPSGDLKEGRFVINICRQNRVSKQWSCSILPFASWGCGILSCLDLSDSCDPPIYRFEPNMPGEFTNQYLKGQSFRGIGLIPESVTLTEWLNEWLDGKAEQMFTRMNAI